MLRNPIIVSTKIADNCMCYHRCNVPYAINNQHTLLFKPKENFGIVRSKARFTTNDMIPIATNNTVTSPNSY